jgi:hypothetical protein
MLVDDVGAVAVTLAGIILAMVLFSNELSEYMKPFTLQTVSAASFPFILL